MSQNLSAENLHAQLPDGQGLEDTRVESFTRVVTPAQLHAEIPATAAMRTTVAQSRAALRAILQGSDRRRFLVVGPCSVHDPDAALEYAQGLGVLAQEVADTLLLVMRVYFEKPRTTVGWKGLINDPGLDGTFDVERGLRLARGLLAQINAMGVPAGTEALDPVIPQYYSDLISWYAIGARTTESQTHREMASGLSAPVDLRTGPTAGWMSPLMPGWLRWARTRFWASMPPVKSVWCARAAIRMATSYCGEVVNRTTTVPRCAPRPMPCAPCACRRVWWWTARTPIRARIHTSSHASSISSYR